MWLLQVWDKWLHLPFLWKKETGDRISSRWTMSMCPRMPTLVWETGCCSGHKKRHHLSSRQHQMLNLAVPEDKAVNSLCFLSGTRNFLVRLGRIVYKNNQTALKPPVGPLVQVHPGHGRSGGWIGGYTHDTCIWGIHPAHHPSKSILLFPSVAHVLRFLSLTVVATN